MGGVFDRPPRGVCWHRTEGGDIAGAVSVYQKKLACPHFTVDFTTREKVQHVPLTSSSYALQHGDETHICHVETNKSGLIQIEVVGFSADSWTVSKEQLRWLGEDVLWPILDECPTIPRDAVYEGPRMNEQQWDAWTGGQCGHRDVCCQPDGHTDPGDLDLKAILGYATGDTVTPEDIEAIAKRTEELIWTRVLSIKNEAGALEDHAAVDVLAFAYEQARRAAGGVKGLSRVAITTEEP